VPVVLVIDDDPAARELVARSAEKSGFRAITAARGEDGLQMAREFRPAAIVLDVIMAGMDGWEVLSQLKTDPELAQIPVTLISITENRRIGFALGANEYLVKPVDRSQLVRILTRFCGPAGSNVALVVDDEQANRNLLRRMLESQGWTVCEAANGRQALQFVDSSPVPRLIMLDLLMPEMDGFQFMEEIAARPAASNIPVVVVTAKDLTAEDRRRLERTVTHVIERSSHSEEDLLRRISGELANLAYAPLDEVQRR
jgi:CheY-like chemotaxis protein